MLVYADGSISGSIGGGEMEARVVREAMDVLAERRPRRLSYSLLDPRSGDPGVCGGEVELLGGRIGSAFCSPVSRAASNPSPISTPLVALMLIIAPARSASSLP